MSISEIGYDASGERLSFAWPNYSRPSLPPRLGETPVAHNIEAFVISRCASLSNTALEIGTHFGFFSVLIARSLRGKQRSFVGVELMARNAQIANFNLRQNGLGQQALVINAAIAAERSEDCLPFDVHAENSNLLGNTEKAIHGIGISHVATLTLPDIRDYFGNFDMLKIDIEGYETFIFASAEAASLLDGFNIVCLEVHVDFIKYKFARDPRSAFSAFAGWYGFCLVCENVDKPKVARLDEIALEQHRVLNCFFFRGDMAAHGAKLFEECRGAP